MKLNKQQRAAVDDIVQWFSNASGGSLYRLFGYAGTGKTTIAREIVKAVCDNPDIEVVFTALTGKACEVLRSKGCPATTIHSLLYSTSLIDKVKLRELNDELKEAKTEFEKLSIQGQINIVTASAAQPKFKLNEKVQGLEDVKLIVVDEASMVNDTIGADLMGLDIPVLVLGDPAQLPPPKGMGYFTHKNVKPNCLLTEIQRQELDSGILEVATAVRQGESIPFGNVRGDCEVIRRSELTTSRVLAADQVLVGKNATRTQFNDRIRGLKGLTSKWPVAGEKLICLRNNHDKKFQNGGFWTMLKDAEEDALEPEKIKIYIESELDGRREVTYAWKHHFTGVKTDKPWWELDKGDEFTYGYAITVHKSQGSQWDNVLIMNEARIFRNDAQKWLYTAITRAVKNVTVVV